MSTQDGAGWAGTARPGSPCQAPDAAGGCCSRRPTLRTVHRHVPSPPLKVGIAIDVSGSIRPFTKPLASAAWIVAQAAGWSDATAATVCFGEQVTAITRPGQVLAQVRQFHADDRTEVFCQAVDALDGALGLSRAGDGARLLVVVSDGYYTPKQRSVGHTRVRRLLATGCGVLWFALRSDPKPLDGAQVVLLKDPSVAGAVIGAPCGPRHDLSHGDRHTTGGQHKDLPERSHPHTDGRARVRLYRAAGFAQVAWTTRPWGHAAVLVRPPEPTGPAQRSHS